MNEVLIVKNVQHEGSGLIEVVLKENGITYSVVDLESGDAFPSPRGYRAVVVMGGPDSANDDTVKMRTELERARECLDLGIPYLGVCLGLQVLVKAAGGEVVSSSVREIGFRDPDGDFFDVVLTDEGREDALFDGLDDLLHVFHLHGETVELTDTMELLASGAWCKNQVVKVAPRAYGTQCHFELTPEMFYDWLDTDPELQKLDRFQLETDYAELAEEYNAVGRRLVENFLRVAGLIN